MISPKKVKPIDIDKLNLRLRAKHGSDHSELSSELNTIRVEDGE
jgi:hypothetical protein